MKCKGDGCNEEIAPSRRSGLCTECYKKYLTQYNREYRRKRRQDPEYTASERKKQRERQQSKGMGPRKEATGLIKGMTRNEYARKWRREHPISSRGTPWSKENPERYKEYRKEYYQENSERINRYNRRWQRHKAVDQARAEGNIVCYWCKGKVPEHRIKKCARANPPRFCGRSCYQHDIHEERLLTDYYREFSKLGNGAQERIEAGTGVRPGHQKRVDHVKRLNATRTAELQQELDADPE